MRVLPTLRQGRGCGAMDSLTEVLISVVAGVITYYVCKWLDSR